MARVTGFLGHGGLLLITAASAIAVLLILLFVGREAVPFFRLRGVKEFFTNTAWYPSRSPASFGALAIFFGSAMVTVGAAVVAVPLGVSAAVCLSDVIPFRFRQLVKPCIEMLAAIPSVAYGFFALVVFAPLLQRQGGHLLAVGWWLLGVPLGGLVVVVLSDLLASWFSERARPKVRVALLAGLGVGLLWALWAVGSFLGAIQIGSGTNALNVSIILGVMALPTVVSVSEDALTAVGRDLREGSYALGATRAETMLRVVIPAAAGGILAAVLLGTMRAVGETMVVWMASGNAAAIPQPWYNYLSPVRTLTATIAGDMGEADQVTGSARYHVLFAMGLSLVVFCYLCNLLSEWAVRRMRRKMS
jgi:phosphate transport system permease protein